MIVKILKKTTKKIIGLMRFVFRTLKKIVLFPKKLLHVPSLFRAVTKKLFFRLWFGWLAKHRYLYSYNNKMTIKQSAILFVLKHIDRISSSYYEKKFRSLEQKINLPRLNVENSNKIYFFSIGTLGPGGAERQFVQTITQLRSVTNSPIAVECYNLDSGPNCFFEKDLIDLGIHPKQLNFSPVFISDSVIKIDNVINSVLPSCFHVVRSYLSAYERLKPTTVHLWLDEVNIMGGIAAILFGVKNVVLSTRSVSPQNFLFYKPWMWAAYKYILNHQNVILLSNSKRGAEDYEKWLGLDQGKINVIYNGFNINDNNSVNCNSEITDTKLKLGTVGFVVLGAVFRMSEEKQPMLWLDIASHVKKVIPNIKFVIVGDGVMRHLLFERASKPDLLGSVVFTGHRSDVSNIIKSFDGMLLTSRVEGLPNVLIEAQLAGVPVLSTNAGGASETFINGITGFIIDENDLERTVELVIKAISDKKWIKTAKDKMQEFVKENFDNQVNANKCISMYN